MARNPEETRNKIISSAKMLFIKQGYRGTGTKQIAEQAGVSEMTLFRHFAAKEHIYSAVVQPLIDFLERLELKEAADFRVQIRELLQDRLMFLCEERELVRFAIMEGYLTPGGFNPAAEAAQKIGNLLAPVGGEKQELYLRLIMGYVLTWIFLPDNCDENPQLDELVELLK
jgi:AcrR family transcriptional regulator